MHTELVLSVMLLRSKLTIVFETQVEVLKDMLVLGLLLTL